MFDLYKIQRIYDSCFKSGNHSLSSDVKKWAKKMLKDGRPHSDIVMFSLLENYFFDLQKDDQYSLFHTDIILIFTLFGLETFTRIKEQPSIFNEVYDYRCIYHVYSGMHGTYNGFGLDNDKETWEQKKHNVLKNIDRIQVVYNDLKY